MTKILYIPGGSYIQFYVVNNDKHKDYMDLSEIVEEYMIERPLYSTPESFIEFLISNEFNADCEWYKGNNIEEGHIFLKSELEIIYA